MKVMGGLYSRKVSSALTEVTLPFGRSFVIDTVLFHKIGLYLWSVHTARTPTPTLRSTHNPEGVRVVHWGTNQELRPILWNNTVVQS